MLLIIIFRLLLYLQKVATECVSKLNLFFAIFSSYIFHRLSSLYHLDLCSRAWILHLLSNHVKNGRCSTPACVPKFLLTLFCVFSIAFFIARLVPVMNDLLLLHQNAPSVFSLNNTQAGLTSCLNKISVHLMAA